MNISKRVLNTFNDPNTLIVLSKYPYLDNAHSHHGVATYTQHTLEAVSQKTNQKFIVLVEKEYDRPEVSLVTPNILVVACFDGNLGMFAQILKTLQYFDKVNTIQIHSEYYTSGDPLQMAFAVPFYTLLKVMGKRVIYFAHNILSDFGFMARHLGKKTNSWYFKSLEKILPLYYRFLGASVSTFVVLDESLKKRVEKYLNPEKLVITPHWIYPKSISSGKRAYWRKKMGFTSDDIVLVCFGFMTRYKGVDWLVDVINELVADKKWKNIHLVLAGGKAPSQTGKKHYEQFYSELERKVALTDHVSLTGFVKEDDVQNYFAISDIVVLPYRGVLGASGSWAQTLAYGKPFVLSSDLAGYLENEETHQVLEGIPLEKQDFIFHRNKVSFAKHLEKIIEPLSQKRMTRFSKEVAAMRSPESRLRVEKDLLYTGEDKKTTSAWSYVLKAKKLIPLVASQ